MNIQNNSSENIFNTLKLKEHSIYKVTVKVSENNVEHTSILFTGFKTGSYSTVYNNSYDYPIDLNKCYSIKNPIFLCDIN